MVFSLIGIILSIVAMNVMSYESDEKTLGLPLIIINLFFLAFSITATVVSFRKKNVTA